MSRIQQAGFGLIEIILIVVILGVITLIGAHIYQTNQTVSQEAVNESTIPKSHVSKAIKNAPQITSVGDLDTASKVLDNTQIDDGTTSHIDAQLNF